MATRTALIKLRLICTNKPSNVGPRPIETQLAENCEPSANETLYLVERLETWAKENASEKRRINLSTLKKGSEDLVDSYLLYLGGWRESRKEQKTFLRLGMVKCWHNKYDDNRPNRSNASTLAVDHRHPKSWTEPIRPIGSLCRNHVRPLLLVWCSQPWIYCCSRE